MCCASLLETVTEKSCKAVLPAQVTQNRIGPERNWVMRKIISHHVQHITRDCGFRRKRFIQEYVCFFLLTLLVVAPALQGNGQSRPKFVKYCSLFDSTYDERTVSSIALMFYSTVGRVDGGDTFLYSPDCNGPDYFSIPSGNSKVWGKWQSFFDKLPPEKNLAIEIKFEGKPDVAIAGLFGSLDGWARAEIKFSKIVSSGVANFFRRSAGIRAVSSSGSLMAMFVS